MPFTIALMGKRSCSSRVGRNQPAELQVLEVRRLLSWSSPLYSGAWPNPGIESACSVAADFNADGWQDVASVGPNSSGVSILLNSSLGFSQAPILASSQLTSMSLETADFNVDGRPDLVVAGATTARLAIMMGQGYAAFSTSVIDLPSVAFDVCVSDLNNDGRLDLVAVLGAAKLLWIAKGTGTGAFQPGILVPLAVASTPYDVSCADFNADGVIDIAVSATQSPNDTPTPIASIWIGLGSATGLPTPSVVLQLPGYHQDTALADVNGDGRCDILNVADTSTGRLSVYLSNPSDTFVLASTTSLPAYSSALTTAETNGDGKLDVIVLSGGKAASILLGNGSGAFAFSGNAVPMGSGFSIAKADLDRDGHVDVIMPSTAGRFVSIAYGTGNGTWKTAAPVLGNDPPAWTAVGDFNADGRPDLASLASNGLSIRVLLNTAVRQFGTLVTVSLSSAASELVATDVNRDGAVDLLTGNGLIVRGSRTAQFTAGPSGLPSGLFSMKVADFNRDGFGDIVACSYSSQSFVSLYLGTATGAFSAGPSRRLSFQPQSMAVGDLNGDSLPDVAVSYSQIVLVSVFFSNSSGVLGSQPVNRTNLGAPLELNCLDVDRDGFDDLLAVDGGYALTLAPGSLDWQGAASTTLHSNRASRLKTMDVDADGLTDVVCMSDASTFTVHRGKPDGTLSPAAVHSTPIRANSLSLADLDADGAVDVVLGGDSVAPQGGTCVSWGRAHPAVAPQISPGRVEISVPAIYFNSDSPIDDVSIAPEDLIITNLTTAQVFRNSQSVLLRSDRQAFGFTLSTNLPDGVYRFTLSRGTIRGSNGLPTTVDVVTENSDTFLLAGDANRDRSVNFSDLLVLAQNYGQSSRTFSQGDFNYDGNVNFNDLLLLAQRYGTQLNATNPSPMKRRKSNAVLD
jgi:hypothetical protein